MELTCEEFDRLRRQLHEDPASMSDCELKAYDKHFTECQEDHRRNRENLVDDLLVDILLK